MLRLVCPCGHTTPLPEKSGRYVCSFCQRALLLTWHDGVDAWKRYDRWRQNLGRPSGVAALHVEYIPAEIPTSHDPYGNRQ